MKEDIYERIDRKSTRLNSSHGYISYAVFCLKKKTLDTPVGRGLELKIASLLVAREVTGERAHDVSWACVVPFDEVAVVGVHDADEVRKTGGRRWMEAGPELGGRCSELCDDVVEFPRHPVNNRRLDPAKRLRFDPPDRPIGRSRSHRRYCV